MLGWLPCSRQYRGQFQGQGKGLTVQGRGQGQGLIAQGQGQDQGLGTQGEGQGLAVQSQDQKLETQDQERGQLASTVLDAKAMSLRTPYLMSIKGVLRTVWYCTPPLP